MKERRARPRCRHYACRCARAAELSAMGGVLMAEAVGIWRMDMEVTCRERDQAEQAAKAVGEQAD